jgi:hypothetical protein
LLGNQKCQGPKIWQNMIDPWDLQIDGICTKYKNFRKMGGPVDLECPIFNMR